MGWLSIGTLWHYHTTASLEGADYLWAIAVPSWPDSKQGALQGVSTDNKKVGSTSAATIS